MDLRSRYLDSLKAIVFKQYNQVSWFVTLFKVKSCVFFFTHELEATEQVGSPRQQKEVTSGINWSKESFQLVNMKGNKIILHYHRFVIVLCFICSLVIRVHVIDPRF